jgi:hypothetical protein
MSEFDSIDDELFSLDYRSERPTRHISVLPEPPTVRMRPYAPRRSVDDDVDEHSGEMAIVIGLAVLLVVVIATVGLVLWWWA